MIITFVVIVHAIQCVQYCRMVYLYPKYVYQIKPVLTLSSESISKEIYF